MHIDLILSKIPSQKELSQIFKKFGFETCVFLQENDWESLGNDSSEIIVNFSKILDKKWLCHLDIFIDKHIENEKLFYFSTAKQLAQIADCNVICCYYDNDIINNPPDNNPFYDFALIGNHWYLIDDSHSDYANDKLKGGEIKIVKSIDKEMAYFLEFGGYFRDIK